MDVFDFKAIRVWNRILMNNSIVTHIITSSKSAIVFFYLVMLFYTFCFKVSWLLLLFLRGLGMRVKFKELVYSFTYLILAKKIQPMKSFISIIFLICSISSFAQKQEVLAKLAEYGITAETLGTGLQDHDATHSFDVDITTNNGTKNIVEVGHFNPLVPIGERWTLETVNDKAPSKKELKKFDKAHNTKQPDINGKVSDKSWKIDSDTEKEIIISFKYEKESLPNKFQFLADCTGKAYIDKRTKRLKKAVFKNDGPLKVKIFNVTKLEMTVDYHYIKEENLYVMDTQHLDMQVKLLGQLVEVEELNEYYHYKKVK